MPLGNLKPHTGTKKYTVGLISDSHISGTPTNYCGTEKIQQCFNIYRQCEM